MSSHTRTGFPSGGVCFAWRQVLGIALCGCMIPCTVLAQENNRSAWNDGQFRWQVSEPLVSVVGSDLPKSEAQPWVAVKDPSIVRYEDRWHLFCTLRRDKEGDGRIRIGYMNFSQWSEAQNAHWSLIDLVDGYHGAPQVFYFRPHKTWYMIYQAGDPKSGLKYGSCYSTNSALDKPAQWSKPKPMYVVPEGKKAGLDFWVICDDQWAYMFYTTNDGKMWRTRTRLSNFPDRDWSEPVIALQADIFEASHTYRLHGSTKYVTLIEAQGANRRYFKAYVADSLDGQWNPLAADRETPFVSTKNVINQESSWATSYSHGEIIRSGFDESLEIAAPDAKLEILFQGVSDGEYAAGNYGKIPWRLGLLKQQ